MHVSAWRDREVVGHNVNGHRHQNGDRRDPEERAVVHSFPVRAVRRVFGSVITAMLLKFRIIHRDKREHFRLRLAAGNIGALKLFRRFFQGVAGWLNSKKGRLPLGGPSN